MSEVRVSDASEFAGVIRVRGAMVARYRVLRTASTALPNAIAATLLAIRDRTGTIPHVYFGWTKGNPFLLVLKYVAFGQGAIAPVTREILRQAELDPERRPVVHVGGWERASARGGDPVRVGHCGKNGVPGRSQQDGSP